MFNNAKKFPDLTKDALKRLEEIVKTTPKSYSVLVSAYIYAQLSKMPKLNEARLLSGSFLNSKTLTKFKEYNKNISTEKLLSTILDGYNNKLFMSTIKKGLGWSE